MSEKAILHGSESLREKDFDEMNGAEVLERIIELGFDGNREVFQRFRETLRRNLPPGTGVALRGSVVTNERYEDGQPFDAKGERTSDLDVTLIGEEVRALWNEDAYYIPALHTKPLGDKDPDIAPALNELRVRLQEMAGRPVNFQATANFILFVRDVLLGQPYFMIIEPEETAE